MSSHMARISFSNHPFAIGITLVVIAEAVSCAATAIAALLRNVRRVLNVMMAASRLA